MLSCSRCVQQSQVEAEEEYITNKLMKRLEQLKKEKQILANEVCCSGACPSYIPQQHLQMLHVNQVCMLMQCASAASCCRSKWKRSF